MRVLSHDAFARFETLRRTETGEYVGNGWTKPYECANCGTVRRTKSGKPSTYRYGTQSDAIGARVSWDAHVFCGKSCRDSFHS